MTVDDKYLRHQKRATYLAFLFVNYVPHFPTCVVTHFSLSSAVPE